MQLRPKKLALLISLIGAGVSPYAYARSDVRTAGPAPSPLSIALGESATWTAAPAWREDEDGALELVKLPEDLQYSIWVPPSSVLSPDDKTTDEAQEPPSEFSDAAPGEAPGDGETALTLARASPARLAVPAPQQSVRTLPVQPVADVVPTHAERLMESLAAVVFDDVDTPGSDAADLASVEPVPMPAPSLAKEAADEPMASRLRSTDPATLLVEQREIVVAPASDRVMRDLAFVLWGDEDNDGAAPPAETIVATQADKVLATLEDTLFARHAYATPIEPAAREAMDVDIDLSQPMPFERLAVVPALMATPPADDVGATPAMEPGPMQWFIGPQYVTSGTDIEAGETARPSPFGGDQVAINHQSLDRIRGGFVGDGLNVSFGIERAVYVNGTLVTTTSLNLSDLGRITAGRGTASFDTGTLALIQSGAGNSVSSGSFSSTSIGTVVQNTLNGQKIQSVTVINATVNSLGVLRGLNLQQSMRGAVIDSLRR